MFLIAFSITFPECAASVALSCSPSLANEFKLLQISIYQSIRLVFPSIKNTFLTMLVPMVLLTVKIMLTNLMTIPNICSLLSLSTNSEISSFKFYISTSRTSPFRISVLHRLNTAHLQFFFSIISCDNVILDDIFHCRSKGNRF